jgi:nucleoside triphosphate pyrophosphatase
MGLQNEAVPLVLASGSATRRAMLEAAGLALEVLAPGVDEDAVKRAARAEGWQAIQLAETLASLKAERVSRRLPGAVVIGADQVLDCEGDWFDKPADRAAAEAHLRALAGRTHRLATAVSCFKNGAQIWHHSEAPRLAMRNLSDAFIGEYLAAEGEAVLHCVGAYRLEGPGIQLFDRVDGDHFAILGLPLLPLLGFLRQHGALVS